MKKSLILVSLFALFFPLIAYTQVAVTNQRLYDTIPNMPDHYTKRVDLFKTESIVKGKVIFLGNSITEGGNWKQLIGDTTAINRGIGGDITLGVIKRLDDVISREPSKLFILIGINDIGKDIPDVVIAENYSKIIHQIQLKSPSTKIYIQSILPINSTVVGFPQHYDKQNHIISTNKLIKKLAKEAHCQFINLFPRVLDKEGYLEKKYTYDGLHLNATGYDFWVKYLKKEGYL